MTDDERHLWIEHELAEMDKYRAETRKLEAEARHFDRVWLIGAVSAGAALFAAAAAFVKLVL